MAHPQQLGFFSALAHFYPDKFSNTRAIEVGSLDINGGIRQLFSNCNYTGFDMQLGPGVDVCTPGQLIELPTGSVETLVSGECFEHNPYWVETFANMLRMSSSTALVAFTCATTGRHEHGTARANHSLLSASECWNYYRNLDTDDFRDCFPLERWFAAYQFFCCPQTFDLYFYGLRGGDTPEEVVSRFVNVLPRMEKMLQDTSDTVRIGYWTSGSGWQTRVDWRL
jgi:hypothetical protein